VVPATPERPATPTEPQQWQLHPPSETVAISRWPKIPNFVFAATDALPAPALSDLDWRDTDLAYRARLMRAVPLRQESLWPHPPQLAQADAAIALPGPAASIFKIPEATRVTMLAAAPAHRATAAPRETEELAKPVSARSRIAASRRAARSKHTAQQAPHPGHAAPKHAAQAKKKGRSVRVAALKKR
jgi:hypothetical protein